MSAIARLRSVLEFVGQPDTWRRVAPCDVLLVCNDSDRAYVYRGQRYSQLLDSLGDRLRSEGLRCATVSRGLSRLTGERSYGSPASINMALLRIIVTQRLLAVVTGARRARGWRVGAEARLWGDVLRRSGARMVVGIQPDAGLCRAASARGIPVYDLQHGITETTNDAYYRLEASGGVSSDDLPGGYLMWDQDGAEALRAAASRGADVRVTGNPWFARFARPSAEDDLVREALAALPPDSDGRPVVVVTLQHGMRTLAPKHIPDGIMPDALAEAIARSAGRLQWRLRLHPSQMTGPDAASVQSRLEARFGTLPFVEWRRASEVPLPLLLANADAHVTHYSATTIEASWLGLRTALLDPELLPGGRRSHLLARERERAVAVVVPLDADAILSFIEAAVESRRSSPDATGSGTASLDAFAASAKTLIGALIRGQPSDA